MGPVFRSRLYGWWLTAAAVYQKSPLRVTQADQVISCSRAASSIVAWSN
jgi:hypothetical protein